MARIYTARVKRYARMLYTKYPDRFKPDFEHNKQVLKEVAEIPSKKLRNQVAGYLTRMIKKMMVEESSESG
ncbi:MAG TPA: 30S ribosomal protein S17e [Candidatus Bathyarchaeota archaeon]|nr:30S ribosomal protein S17e [Candidatus Bathyarchaeota archaeon]